MKLTVFTSICVALAAVPASYAAVLGPEPTAAPRLVKRVFPTGSAAVASFLATIDPAELSTYFSWAANGNVGFISHAQSFTSANAAQYSSYLAAKMIGSSEASAILGGIQTKSTEAAGTGSSASASGSGASSATASASDASASASDLTTLSNGDVVMTLSNGNAVQGISASENGTLIPVSTTGASGSLVPASTTYLSGGTFLTPTGSSTGAAAAVTSSSGTGAASAASPSASGSSDASIQTLSLSFASLFTTLSAALIAACLVL